MKRLHEICLAVTLHIAWCCAHKMLIHEAHYHKYYAATLPLAVWIVPEPNQTTALNRGLCYIEGLYRKLAHESKRALRNSLFS